MNRLAILFAAMFLAIASAFADPSDVSKCRSAQGQVAIDACGRALNATDTAPDVRIKLLRYRAGFLFHDSKYSQAEIDLDEVLKSELTRSDDWYLRAKTRARQLKLSLAVSDFKKATEMSPGRLDIVGDYARVLEQNGEHAAAITQLQRLVAIFPDDSGYHHMLAIAEYAIGHTENALAELTKACKLAPSIAIFCFDLGDVQTKLGKFEDAISSYSKAILAKPNEARFFEARAFAKRKLRKLKESDNDASIAQKLRSTSPTLALNEADTKSRSQPDSATSVASSKSIAPAGPCFAETGKKGISACTADLKAKWQSKFSRPYTLRRRAALYFETKQYDKAIDDLTPILKTNSAIAADWNWRGINYWWTGRMELALKDIQEANERAPRDVDILENYAEILIASGKGVEAYNNTNELIRLTAKSNTADIARYQDLRSRAALAAKFYKTAVLAAQKATSLSPKVSVYWHQLGLAQYYSNALDLAIKAYTMSIKLDPAKAAQYAARASVYYDAGDFGAAVGDYDAALKIDPKGKWRVDRGISLLHMNDLAGAKTAAKDAKRAGEPEADILTFEGRIHTLEKRLDLAISAFNKAIKSDPSNTSARYWKAVAMSDQGNHAAALPLFAQAAKEWPNDATVMADVANTLLELGRHDEALRAASDAIARDAGAAYALEVRARIHNFMGNYNAARDDSDAALRIDKNRVTPYSRKGYALRQLGKPQEAVSAYDMMLKLSPDYAAGYADRARAHIDLENYAQAKADIDKAIALKNDPEEMQLLLGWYYEKQKSFAAAIEAYGRAVKISPKDGWAYEARAWGLIGADKPAAAADDCRMTIKLMPKVAAAYRCLARAQARMQLSREATKTLEQALKIDPKYGPAYFDLGYEALSASDYEAAVAHFSGAINTKTWLAYSYLYRGDAYKAMKLKKAALRDYTLALGLANADLQKDLALRIQRIDANGGFSQSGAPEYPQRRSGLN